jgi:protein subunit release factor A
VHNLENVLEGDLEEMIMELLKQEKDLKLKEAK